MSGHTFFFGDFNVRVARMQQRDSVRACIVAIEYQPLNVLDSASALLQEFVDMLQQELAGAGGTLEVVNPPFGAYSLPSTFSFQHAALQLATVVSAIQAPS
eukprot:jgi/Botrbrau1/2407/Bobra.0395s0036.1